MNPLDWLLALLLGYSIIRAAVRGLARELFALAGLMAGLLIACWTYVSAASTGLVASHYPTLLEETEDDSIVIVTYFGRPDEVAHEVGQHEMLVIVQGPHGYVSPNWYEPGDIIPTWNHATAHLYGVPEILSEEENYRVLERLTDHFEHPMPEPRSLASDASASDSPGRKT